MDAKRIANTWAGCDLGNDNRGEAAVKFEAVRRMAAAENMSVIELLDLPEVVAAIDEQMHPVRRSKEEVIRLQQALEECELEARAMMARYEAKLNERDDPEGEHRSVPQFVRYAWSFPGWRLAQAVFRWLRNKRPEPRRR